MYDPFQHDLKGKMAPSWAAQVLRKFGVNPYGAPIYRLIWSQSRYSVVGGYWETLGKSTYVLCQTYGIEPRWILERWHSSTKFISPEVWEIKNANPDGFLSLGEFPVHGVYESCFTFTNGQGTDGYIPVDPGLVETAARLVDMGKYHSYAEKHLSNKEMMAQKQKEWADLVDAEWDDAQHTFSGLTIGPNIKIDPQAEIDDYDRKIKQGVKKGDYTPGFSQV